MPSNKLKKGLPELGMKRMGDGSVEIEAPAGMVPTSWICSKCRKLCVLEDSGKYGPIIHCACAFFQTGEIAGNWLIGKDGAELDVVR